MIGYASTCRQLSSPLPHKSVWQASGYPWASGYRWPDSQDELTSSEAQTSCGFGAVCMTAGSSLPNVCKCQLGSICGPDGSCRASSTGSSTQAGRIDELPLFGMERIERKQRTSWEYMRITNFDRIANFQGLKGSRTSSHAVKPDRFGARFLEDGVHGRHGSDSWSHCIPSCAQGKISSRSCNWRLRAGQKGVTECNGSYGLLSELTYMMIIHKRQISDIEY